ncbi:hypothetical protein GCM10008938_45840 [Deinococcus roseus]|uniref:Uncharacterized protein n=2 Tax=Deinococcus roseus TaxID=392414 RepID=A0ABQ2DF37_9DEIO|nr:hypothetical protein GCM10008938_45840 [Deinococcus roseus]
MATAQCVEKPETPLFDLGLKEPRLVKSVYDYKTIIIDENGKSLNAAYAEDWTLRNGKVVSYMAYRVSSHEKVAVKNYIYQNERMVRYSE